MGDCWFLSAVAVLTEVSPISQVIITPEYNEEGIYTVRFCIQVSSCYLEKGFILRIIRILMIITFCIFLQFLSNEGHFFTEKKYPFSLNKI